MTIRISSNGLQFEADTEADLRIVLRVIGENQPQMALPIDGVAVNGSIPDRMRAMHDGLSPNQNRMVVYLSTSDWVQRENLRQAIGASSHLTIAGLWTGVVRNAKKHGLTADQVFRKDQREADGAREYWYRLTDEYRAVVRQP